MQGRIRVILGQVQAGRWILLLLCSWVYGHVSQAQGTNSSSDIPVRVHGVVLNAVTQTPISRALVTSADQRMALMTDDKGRFEFEVQASPGKTSTLHGLPGEGAVFLVARKPGYLVMERPRPLMLADQTALRTEVRLHLMPESTVSGVVTAPGADPPSGLMVQLLRKQLQDGTAMWMQTGSQAADVRGRYRFGELMPGEYKVVTMEWVDRDGPYPSPGGKPMLGYPPAAFSNGSTPATAGILHLSGGRSVEADINLRAAAYYTIDIPLLNTSQTDFGRVSVESEDGSDYSLGFDGRTQRVVGALPDGVYHLTVIENAGQPGPNKAPIMLTGSSQLTVAGKPVQGSPIKLSPGITVPVDVSEQFTKPDPYEQAAPSDAASTGAATGAVVSKLVTQGVPLQEPEGKVNRPRVVEVFLGSSDQSAGGFGLRNGPQSDSENQDLVIENVPPGTYRVQVSPRRGYVASATANGLNLLREPLVIAPGATSTAIAIVLRDDTATITGKVSPYTSKEVGGLIPRTVWAYPLDDRQGGRPNASAEQSDGTFTMSDVVPGRYLVLASQAPSLNIEYRNPDVMKAYESKGVIVSVSSGQTVDVELKDAVAGEDWPEMETVE